MKTMFGVQESPWAYRSFWFISILCFVIPAWLGPSGALLTDAFNTPTLARITSSLVRIDQWVVEPHVRLLEFISPPLVERWPGPIAGGLTVAHRALFSIFYGLLGWICVRFIWYQFETWWLRIWWIFIYWAVCVGFVHLVALLLKHFGRMGS